MMKKTTKRKKPTVSKAKIKVETVNHPNHYNHGKYEVIDVIEDWNLDFSLGNAIKYIARCNYKENKIEDLKKAVWYIQHEIDKDEEKENAKEDNEDR